MKTTLALFAAAAFALSMGSVANAAATPPYKLDAKGKCHGSNGQFAKQALCSAGASTSGTSTPAATGGPYKADAKGNCHDPKGKMVTKTLCKAS